MIEMNKTFNQIKKLWSTTEFGVADLNRYAANHLLVEARIGVMSMSVLLLMLVLAALVVNNELQLGSAYFNTYLVVLALCVHIFISARNVDDLNSLNLLGVTLLVLSSAAFVSIAHQTEGFTPLLFSNIVLLFMLVPVIPWGLREACAVILMIYFMISFSVAGRLGIFDASTLWTLQFFMLAAGVISASLVAFNVSVRKNDLKTRYDLEKAHDRMHRLSNIDPLTGVWNRRFLETGVALLKEKFPEAHLQYAIFDLDAFKKLNDTFGHEFGDKMLCLISDAFTDEVMDKGFLVRIGGDEFVLLMVSDTFDEALAKIKQLIDVRLAVENNAELGEFGLSMGVVNDVPLQGNVNLDVLYKEADGILYGIKRRRYQAAQASETLPRTERYKVEKGTGYSWGFAK